mgnify:CR=1 FL=1
MKRGETSTKCAGIDVGKQRLEVAVHGEAARLDVDNRAEAFAGLTTWLEGQGVGRVGLEASGGYERGVRRALEEAGFEVVLHQPLEVRLFARLRRRKAKNDRLDAALIAAATAQVDTVRAAADPRLQELAEWMTAYEQVSHQLASFKAFMEHAGPEELRRRLTQEIASLTRLKAELLDEIRRRIVPHADLEERYRLLLSLPGIGPVGAMSLLIRMPELGSMRRGQAAALLGVAPFDRDSGQYKGHRFIAGGRARPRRMLYLAAITARRWDPSFKALSDRMLARGKPAKVTIVAIMRHLIEAANLVLARATPWSVRTPA